MLKTFLLFLLILFCFFTVDSYAQANGGFTSNITAKVHKIKSKALGEEYELLIHLPENYSKEKTLPVVFVLDGRDAFPFAVEYLKLVRIECEKQEPILVAVSDGTKIGEKGNKRSRDYTPTVSTVSWAQGEGGAAKFLEFLEKEALPFVEQNYSASKDRTIYGHSYGGLFAAYALLNKPELFSKILLGSPALYYDNEVIFKTEAELAKTRKDLPVQVFLTAGEKEEWAVEGNQKFVETLTKRNYPNLKIESIKLAKVGHLTGSPISLMQSLNWAFCR
jgi:uncharacterized protein